MFAILCVFLVLSLVALAELIWISRNKTSHSKKEAATSFALGAMNIGFGSLFQPVPLLLIALSIDIRFFEVEANAIAWCVCFVLDDLIGYWMHRMSHVTGWGWVDHFAHHTAKEFNLFVALRLGSVGVFTPAVLAPIPLVLTGFPPEMILICHSANAIYQFFLHTELIDTLPKPIEWILNTPEHHRVHHARNTKHLDKNFGGVFIIWDRIFGTFSRKGSENLIYGTNDSFVGNNPIKIAFDPTLKMLSRVAQNINRPTEMARLLFGKPGDWWK